MKVYSVNDPEFSVFGCVLQGYDFAPFAEKVSMDKMPRYGFYYVGGDSGLESLDIVEELKDREFGGLPIQVGFVKGVNRILNCFEYHKSTELNIALDDMYLVLGRREDIVDGKYDLKKCKVFMLPAGCGVELYAGTMHYAPMKVHEDGYRLICVLPKGTNDKIPGFQPKSTEDRMLGGINKWIMAHPHCEDAQGGMYVGLEGQKIIADIFEK